MDLFERLNLKHYWSFFSQNLFYFICDLKKKIFNWNKIRAIEKCITDTQSLILLLIISATTLHLRRNPRLLKPRSATSLQHSAMLTMRCSTNTHTTTEWSCFASSQKLKRRIFKSTRRLKLSAKQFRMSKNEPLNKRCVGNRQHIIPRVRSVRTWRVSKKPRRCQEAPWRLRVGTLPRIHPRKEVPTSMTALITLWTFLHRFHRLNLMLQGTTSLNKNSEPISKVALWHSRLRIENALNTRKINKEMFCQLEIKLIKAMLKCLRSKNKRALLQLM